MWRQFDERTRQLKFARPWSDAAPPGGGITAGVEKAGTSYAAAGLFLTGSTIAIKHHPGAHRREDALIITQGFRDIYEIGRINRPDAYNLFFKKHEPLVERACASRRASRACDGGNRHRAR